ncbi:unnamed protein product [Brugia timori]|uniref:Transposase n=1 Tax=Brugia timori TaxID=42155 RepID=A0A0R3QPK5_9BILA|nr:unnamed protein product [Brugia timori]
MDQDQMVIRAGIVVKHASIAAKVSLQVALQRHKHKGIGARMSR